MGEDDPLKAWFCREIIPLEGALTRYLRRNWRDQDQIMELRQDIYARIIEGAQVQIPRNAKAWLFAAARNHLINTARRARIVCMETVADLENSSFASDLATPERVVTARDQLRLVQAGLDRLPARCREVILLRRIEGLSQKQVAERMGVTVSTVEQQTTRGMRALVDFVLAGGGGEDEPRLTSSLMGAGVMAAGEEAADA